MAEKLGIYQTGNIVRIKLENNTSQIAMIVETHGSHCVVKKELGYAFTANKMNIDQIDEGDKQAYMDHLNKKYSPMKGFKEGDIVVRTEDSHSNSKVPGCMEIGFIFKALETSYIGGTYDLNSYASITIKKCRRATSREQDAFEALGINNIIKIPNRWKRYPEKGDILVRTQVDYGTHQDIPLDHMFMAHTNVGSRHQESVFFAPGRSISKDTFRYANEEERYKFFSENSARKPYISIHAGSSSVRSTCSVGDIVVRICEGSYSEGPQKGHIFEVTHEKTNNIRAHYSNTQSVAPGGWRHATTDEKQRFRSNPLRYVLISNNSKNQENVKTKDVSPIERANSGPEGRGSIITRSRRQQIATGSRPTGDRQSYRKKRTLSCHSQIRPNIVKQGDFS